MVLFPSGILEESRSYGIEDFKLNRRRVISGCYTYLLVLKHAVKIMTKSCVGIDFVILYTHCMELIFYRVVQTIFRVSICLFACFF